MWGSDADLAPPDAQPDGINDDEVVTTMDLTRRADRLEAALTRCHSMEALATTLFQNLQIDVPFAFGCLATTDPLTGVITWAYKSHPLEIGDEEMTATEYGEPDINQFAEIAGRPVPIGVLSHDTGGQPEHCRRFRDYLVPRFGFTDEVRMVLRARGLTWAALALYRAAGQAPFSAAETSQRLMAVQDVITDAVRRTLFSAEAIADDRASEPAVVIIDSAGQPRQMTRAARDRIEDLGGWDNGSLPASLLAIAASARAGAGVVSSRVRLGAGPWLTLHGSVLEGAGPGSSVVVTIDLARPAELTGLTLIGRGLTAREQEIATLVVRGASTKAIAAALHLSPHTVQDHLKAIFAKLGINSRRQLISQLNG